MGLQVLNVGVEGRGRRRPCSPRTTGIGAREISGTDVSARGPSVPDRSCRITFMAPKEVTGVDRRAR